MTPASDAYPVIGVAGLGETGPVAEDPRSLPEMVLEAVDAALLDAGITHREVDAVVTASVDLFDGLTASNIAVTEVAGAVMKPETRIAGDGLCALAHAACQIRAGAYDTVLVVAHGKASMAPQDALTEWAMDPIYAQPLGIDFRICAGLVAQALAATDAGASERWATTAAARYHSAGAPPRTARDVLHSTVVAAPLTASMCAPHADAAYAVVLQRRAPGERGGLHLSGFGYDLEMHALGDRDLTAWPGLRRAVDRACALAGIDSARGAFELLEPSARHPHEEELFTRAVDAGPDVVMSPGGGLFSGAAPVAAGLGRLVAAARRMQGDATVRRALAHGTWGPAGQGQVVAILEAAS